MLTIVGTLIGGAIALLGVFITGRRETRKTALASSTHLVAAVQSEIRRKLIQSVENLWLSVNASRDAYKDPLVLHAILTSDEIAEIFLGKSTRKKSMEVMLEDYKDLNFVLKKDPAIRESLTGAEILHVSPRLWSIYRAILTVHGRLGYLICQSFEQKQIVDWKSDRFFLSAIGEFVEEETIDKAKSARIGGVGIIITSLEALFLKESGELIRGTQEFASSVQETYSALQERDEADFALMR